MSLVQFGTNVASIRKKTVGFYNRSGSAVTVYEGMPLCYLFDTDNNVLGINKATNVKGSTTADGYHNEGRFLLTELPEIDNQDWFAGVVAAGPWCNKSVATLATKWLDIYEPNGAIVPVRANVNCVKGRTILAITDDGQSLVNPVDTVPDFATTSSADTAGASDGRPVAIAEETIATLADTAGLVLARLCPNEFMHQGGQIDYEMQVAAGTANVAVNRMMLQFLQTAGHCQALHYRALLTGDGTVVGDGHRGVYRFDTFTQAPVPDTKYLYGIHSHMELGADFSAGDGGGHCAPLALTLRTKNVDPDLSNCGELCLIHCEWHLRKDTTDELTNPPGPDKMSIIYINADNSATEPDQLLKCEQLTNIGAYTSTDTPAPASGDIMIPVMLAGGIYYLCALVDTGLA